MTKKLSWKEWVKENFTFYTTYYTSIKELQDGVAYNDLSHYTQEEVEELFNQYLITIK